MSTVIFAHFFLGYEFGPCQRGGWSTGAVENAAADKWKSRLFASRNLI
jgi:hypothetical protein